MSATPRNKEFLQAIQSLERCLLTPRVPGELEYWLKNSKAAIDAVGAAMAQQFGDEHRTAFNQITSQDSDMYNRVDQLKIGDTQSREQYDALRVRVHQLEKDAPGVEPDEGRLGAELRRLCESGLSLVTQLRKQEVAIDTWLQEAFQRDRGISG